MVLLAIMFLLVIDSCINSSANNNQTIITPDFKTAVEKYRSILPFIDGLAPARRNGKWGFINTLGEEVVPCKYKLMAYKSTGGKYFTDSLVAVSDENGKWGFVNVHGKEIIPCKYDDVRCFEHGHAPVSINGKWGFIDTKGNVLVSLKYDGASCFSGPLAIICDSTKCLLINIEENDSVIMTTNYVQFISDSLVAIKGSNNKYSFVNSNGEITTSQKYDDYIGVGDEIFIVVLGEQNNCKYGFLNGQGKEITPCIYNDVRLDYETYNLVTDGMIMVGRNGRYGFINTKGEETVPCKYSDGYALMGAVNGFSIVEKYGEGKCGIVKLNGKEVVPCIYCSISLSKFGLASVVLSSKDDNEEVFRYGIVDILGNKVIPCIYENTEVLSDSLIKITVNDKSGIKNLSGKDVVPCLYQNVGVFKNGLIMVDTGDFETPKWQVLNESGVIVNPNQQYDQIMTEWDFDMPMKGFAFVCKNNKYGLLNNKGEEVIPCKYYDVLYLNNSFICVSMGDNDSNKKGIINNRCEEVVQCKYDDIQLCDSSLMLFHASLKINDPFFSKKTITNKSDALFEVADVAKSQATGTSNYEKAFSPPELIIIGNNEAYCINGLIDIYGNETFSQQTMEMFSIGGDILNVLNNKGSVSKDVLSKTDWLFGAWHVNNGNGSYKIVSVNPYKKGGLIEETVTSSGVKKTR